MIRTNLSTRPFYNERAVAFWLLVLAIVVVGATIFNVTRIVQYSHNDTQLGVQAAGDESRAADLRQQAARLRATVDPKQIEFASNEAHQANDLIDRRTFSWTELFNRFETTLPEEVRITSVRPHVDKGQINLAIVVVARGVDDVNRFMDNMEASGAFTQLRPAEQHFDDKGLLEASLDAVYVPGSDRGAPAGAGEPR